MNLISVRTGESGYFDRLMVASALTGGLAFTILCLSSIIADGEWALGVNMLSDLGVSDSNTAAMLFNASCILGGLSMMVFSFSKMMGEEKLDRISGLILIVACLQLVMVGIFTEDMPQHSRVAWGFCNTVIIAIIIAAVNDIAKGNWKSIVASGFVALATGISALTMPFPFTEVIMVIAFGAWCAILTVRHFVLYCPR